MATITGTQIVQSVRILAHDTEEPYRDEDAEMLIWLNEATRALCELIPAESTSTENLTLAAGAKQTLPAKALALMSVLRNMGASGATPGLAITPTSRDLLDRFVPGWQNESQSATVVHYMQDVKNPKVFHVYPPAQANIQIEAVLAVPPVAMTSLTEVIKVNDTYAAALINYILFRIFSKDAESEGNAALAKVYYGAFTAAAGSGA